ncbi:hypothetical protein V8J82_17785 [Gymnodinialimonas sp. 2305UL16-5]|uniref:hypothetical protein n=1 Tax=Gymnodinialimonas mytili TaxID=3126503 RepID=UPI0030964EBD
MDAGLPTHAPGSYEYENAVHLAGLSKACADDRGGDLHRQPSKRAFGKENVAEGRFGATFSNPGDAATQTAPQTHLTRAPNAPCDTISDPPVTVSENNQQPLVEKIPNTQFW